MKPIKDDAPTALGLEGLVGRGGEQIVLRRGVDETALVKEVGV